MEFCIDGVCSELERGNILELVAKSYVPLQQHWVCHSFPQYFSKFNRQLCPSNYEDYESSVAGLYPVLAHLSQSTCFVASSFHSPPPV